MDEVSSALCEGSGGGDRLRSDNDKSQRDGFLSLWRRVLVGEVLKHTG